MNGLTAKQLQKYDKKTIAQLIKLATKHFNAYIRNRDSEDGYFTCISCEKTKEIGMMHAGHYLSAGHNASLRFSEDNVHGQCVACNTHLHGNLIRYRENLVKKIGSGKVEILESISRMTHKWNKTGLIWVIETYKKK